MAKRMEDLFDLIEEHRVPLWKYWLKPLANPRWRQYKWTLEDEQGKKIVVRGLVWDG